MESTAYTIKFIGIIVHHLSNGGTFAPDTLIEKYHPGYSPSKPPTSVPNFNRNLNPEPKRYK